MVIVNGKYLLIKYLKVVNMYCNLMEVIILIRTKEGVVMLRETTKQRYYKIIDEVCDLIREGRTAVYAYKEIGKKNGYSWLTVRDICNKPMENN